jgi:hypothetical protein
MTPLVRAGRVFASQADHHKGVYKLARRPNYDYEKRQKEMKRAKKKQQKLEEKRARKATESGEVAATDEKDDTRKTEVEQ